MSGAARVCRPTHSCEEAPWTDVLVAFFLAPHQGNIETMTEHIEKWPWS